MQLDEILCCIVLKLNEGSTKGPSASAQGLFSFVKNKNGGGFEWTSTRLVDNKIAD